MEKIGLDTLFFFEKEQRFHCKREGKYRKKPAVQVY